MYDLEDVIRQRRSIRMFLHDRPVPRELLHEALNLAIRAPSNSDVQPWYVFFASGAARGCSWTTGERRERTDR
jgi:nitroreductase